jgi:pimeloyl-ACP methyl ester carboxylesterase
MQEPTMVRTKGDGLEIQLAVWEGRGKPVLGVHGLTANCRCWDVIAQALAGRHRMLAVDLRGRGLSDKPATGYSEEHHLKDLKCVMDDLQLDRAVLMGHSLGGYISLGFAARYPQRVAGLVLIDAGGELSQEHWDRVTAAIKPSIERLSISLPSMDEYLRLMQRNPVLQPWSQAIETFCRYDLEEASDGSGVRSRIQRAHIEEEVSNKRQTGASQLYPKIECPVLILRATQGILSDEDILLPRQAVEKMLSHIPGARCLDIEGADHYSIIFQPNPVRDQAILDFLAA